jgi:hypothetical protein
MNDVLQKLQPWLKIKVALACGKLFVAAGESGQAAQVLVVILQGAATHSCQGLRASNNSPYQRCLQIEELINLLHQYPGMMGAALLRKWARSIFARISLYAYPDDHLHNCRWIDRGCPADTAAS